MVIPGRFLFNLFNQGRSGPELTLPAVQQKQKMDEREPIWLKTGNSIK